MRRVCSWLVTGALSVCGMAACSPAVDGPKALPLEAAPPLATLTINPVGVPNPGADFVFEVAGAIPGDTVVLLAGNGGLGVDAGPCPPFLGGNCLDFVPGPGGVNVISSGAADANGEVVLGNQLPTTMQPGAYQFQAVVRDGTDSNESPAVEIMVVVPPPACPLDAYEPNNRHGESQAMDGEITDLTICPGDQADFFHIDVEDNAILNVEASILAADGDLDLEMFNENGLLLDGSYTLGDSEVVTWYNLTGSSQRISLLAHASIPLGVNGVSYTLTPEIIVPGVCVDDAAEEDDDPTTARLVGDGRHEAQSCLGDSDWYAIEVAIGDQVDLEIDEDWTLGNVNMHVYDGDLVEQTSGEEDSFTYASAIDQTIYVEAVLINDDDDGGGNSYALEVSRTTVDICPFDVFEPNDDSDLPADMGVGTHEGLGACFASGEDWYAIQVDAGDIIDVQFAFSNDDGDIDVQLFDPYFNEVDRSNSGSDDEELEHTADFTGAYLVRVYLWSGTSDGGPAAGGARYDMTVNLR